MPKNSLTSPLFILMHGLPAAGKSAFARQYAKSAGIAHINSDRLRFELYDDIRFSPSENKTVYRLTTYVADLMLDQSQPLIFDMNLPTQAMRKEVRNLAQSKGFNFAIVWVQTNKTEAKRRAGSRDRRRPDDKYSQTLGPQLFDNIASKSGLPNPDRETVVVISGQQPFSQQQRLAEYKLKQFGYINVDELPARSGRVDFSRRRSSSLRMRRS